MLSPNARALLSIIVVNLHHVLANDCDPKHSNVTLEELGLERIDAYAIPTQACAEMVRMADKHGWDMSADSVDSEPVMDINVFNHGEVLNRAVYELLKPHLPRFKALLDERFGGQESVKNSLDWVFLRKYVGGMQRDGLLAHHDENLHTINVPLNEGYEGGMLYFIPPSSQLGSWVNTEYQRALPMIQSDNVPDLCNSSNYFMPHMQVGVATIYDRTIWHGVSRVRAGARYTLSLFYDEPSRIREGGLDPRVLFTNKQQRSERLISLHWVHTNAAGKPQVLQRGRGAVIDPTKSAVITDSFAPGQEVREGSHIGHWFAAADEDGRILKTWKVTRGAHKFELHDSDDGHALGPDGILTSDPKGEL